MSFYKSINFTQNNHEEISDLLDFQKLPEPKQKEYQEKFEEFFTTSKTSKFLYIIEDNDDRRYKIGITNNVEKRIAQLQTGNPNELEYVAYFHSEIGDILGLEIKYLERFLHKNYADKNIRGEWFNLNPDQVIDICIFLEYGRELYMEFCGIGIELNKYEERIAEMIKEGESDT